MYREENNVYVFDGDLERFLIDKGVEGEYIGKMKKKNLQSDKERYYNSKYIESSKFERENRLVPLSKVIGTSRGTVGKSVYDNVRTMKDGEREPTRFYSCLNFLNRMSLEDLRESYKNIYPVEMEYYTEEDEYYVTSDGNHRTLTAMLVGAEYINANVTPLYCDFEKKNKCIAVESFYNHFNIFRIEYSYIGVKIIFTDNKNYYIVDGFSKRKCESCYEYIEKISDEINKDMKLVKIWSKLPNSIITVLNRFCSNKRIIQYIKKTRPTCFGRQIYIYEYE